MRRGVTIGVGAFALWLAGASLAFVWALGVWDAWPWPSKLWAWLDYALATLPPESAPLVHRYLFGSAVLSAMPVVSVAAVVIRLQVGVRRQKLYGETKWAGRRDVMRGGMRLRRKL